MSKVATKKAAIVPAANQQSQQTWLNLIILVTGSQKNRSELKSIYKDIEKHYKNYIKNYKDMTFSQRWERDKEHGNIFIVTVDVVSTGTAPRVPPPPPPPPIMPGPHSFIMYRGNPRMKESFQVELR